MVSSNKNEGVKKIKQIVTQEVQQEVQRFASTMQEPHQCSGLGTDREAEAGRCAQKAAPPLA
jgi:bacterioferritin-associated ferredoxin